MSEEPSTDLWQNMIVGHDLVDPRTLIPHPQNPRRHPVEQTNALAGSLDELGWIDEITVNRTTGTVTDGHDRIKLAIERGVALVPVRYVQLSIEQERKALLYKDAIGALATYDPIDLHALLDTTTTTNDALVSLLATLADDAGVQRLVDAPEEFPRFADDIIVEHTCPRCGYQFSGGKQHETSKTS